MLSFERIALIVAGLCGAAGIVLSAVQAHLDSNPALQNAALILLVHAPVMIAILAACRASALPRLGGMLALASLIIGVILFSGNIVLRVFAGAPLFPMGAPTGGVFLILGWILIAVSGIFIRRAA